MIQSGGFMTTIPGSLLNGLKCADRYNYSILRFGIVYLRPVDENYKLKAGLIPKK